MKTNNQLNYLNTSAISIENLDASFMRIWEVAQVGGHSVSLHFYEHHLEASRNISREYVSMIADMMQNYATPIPIISQGFADIQFELTRPSFEMIENALLSQKKFESIVDIIGRVKVAKKRKSALAVSFEGDGHFGLFKTAYDRIDLDPYRVSRIVDVAHSIAALAGSEGIRIEHLAEAIQYQSVSTENVLSIF
jgi:Magnesium chelatase, subunit ChlI C-terminal